MRKPIVAGNWKLNKTSPEAVGLATELKAALGSVRDVNVVVCPPFTALAAVAVVLERSSIALGAQDLFWEASGAFTGEVSAPMLTAVSCTYVIVGHSERRQYFGETDETVNKKTLAALAGGLTPIVCVGETLPQREGNTTFEVIRRQLDGGLGGLSAEQIQKLVIAYEPVWAIGTGKNATPQQAQEVHAFIRETVKGKWGASVADGLRIQYGGSVNAANALELMRQPDVDGALVGGASLKVESFVAIVKAAAEAAHLVTK